MATNLLAEGLVYLGISYRGTSIKGALRSFREDILAQNINNYNTNEVIIQTYIYIFP